MEDKGLHGTCLKKINHPEIDGCIDTQIDEGINRYTYIYIVIRVRSIYLFVYYMYIYI